jgi:ubiquinone/menaquinone biosynthesis C-methylase UbiE
MTSAFNPEQYKITTRAQWEDAAEAWHRWGPFIEDWLGDATERMLDAARVTGGSRVLDVATGAGGQSIGAARRAGAGGYVLATDI